MSDSAALFSLGVTLQRAVTVAAICLVAACGEGANAISIPQLGTFDPASDCVDLNARSVSTDQLPKNLIDAVTDDAGTAAGGASLYKVLPEGNSKAQVVFALDRTSDIYIVYSVDLSNRQVLRKFKLGSLHYAPSNPGCRLSGTSNR